MKYYLWHIALALYVSGSAYASKGGNLGTRALARIKAGIESKLANSKLDRTAVVAVLGIVLACGGISGCGEDNSITSPVADESTEKVGEITNSYEGDDIYFEVDGIFYEGRVTAHVSSDEIHVLLDDHSKMVISIEQMGARLIADHSDVGVEVVLDNNQDGETLQHGSILAVYGNGVHKIKIDKVTLVDGEISDLDPPRIRYVHEDASFIEDGGYMTLEEFKEFMIGLQ